MDKIASKSIKTYPWTEDEDLFIQNNLDKIGAYDIAKQLGRSRGAVKSRCKSLGLEIVGTYRWSKREINILNEFYGKISEEELCEKLGRFKTKAAIHHKVSRLGLTTPENKWTELEDNELKFYYENGSWNKKPSRTINAIHNRAAFLGLSMTYKGRENISKLVSKNRNFNSYPNYGKILGCQISKYLSGAKARGFSYELLDGSEENMAYLNSIAKDHCALSGIPIKYITYCRDNTGTASLDRIDCNRGYVKGNVRWIHKIINKMKSNISDEDFLYFCHNISNHNKK